MEVFVPTYQDRFDSHSCVSVCELAANSTLASPPDESRAERKRINERMMKEQSRFHY